MPDKQHCIFRNIDQDQETILEAVQKKSLCSPLYSVHR